ncbi:hypothetical protein jhhlp_008477 [Lomentospora prolificans]|uniref:Glycogen [starch] synthase n=1 Tax=Lomentospora prolificans TaxID=41688 RepID=A0A2N3MY61_9PEZI|nr:hypothetical protein jhhlp_008477 [Lomentospora prolificans]
MEETHQPRSREALLFETSIEVGSQIGGIHTVLRSKAQITVEEYGNRYTLVGPLVRQSAAVEVRECEPSTPSIAAAIKAMETRGVRIIYGRWMIPKAPRVLLIDTKPGEEHLDEWIKDLSKKVGYDLPSDDELITKGVLFAYFLITFMEELSKNEQKRPVIWHGHEWPGSISLILAKKKKLNMATIFTTHATSLGRQICKKSVEKYIQCLQSPYDESFADGTDCYHRHHVERAVAHSCDLFTTVSPITARECENLLQRKPDAILLNGLNVSEISDVNEFCRYDSRSKIDDFVRGHFYGQLDFDLNNTLYFFLAGRYEFTNKGADMYIEALARLNERLKEVQHNGKDTVSVVGFIIMPAEKIAIFPECLESHAIVKSLRGAMKFWEKNIGNELFERAIRWKQGDPLPTQNLQDLIPEEEENNLRTRLYNLEQPHKAQVVTHELVDSKNDPILNRLKDLDLVNRAEDKVKVVFHPEFLRPYNPMLPVNYDEFVRGTDLGVFPSSYEPWGYTPAECAVMGVPSITTNLSGFGYHMHDVLGEHGPKYGVYIADRWTKNFNDCVEQMVDQMFQICLMTHRERLLQRRRVEDLSEILDWSYMNSDYRRARRMALQRRYGEDVSKGDEDIPDAGSAILQEIKGGK